MVRVKWFDNLAYYVRYLATYVLLFGLFFTAGYGKLFGGESAPAKMFTHTFIGGGDALSAAWDLDGVGELVVALLVLASLVTGEWMIGKKKQFLRIALSVAMLLFGVMTTGMSIAGNTAGAASLFFYFGAAAVVYLIVRHDEREAEGKEIRSGVGDIPQVTATTES